jgi:glycosyltransferase involved in cell wall biosynthesis
MRRALDDPQAAARLGRQARAGAQRRFSWPAHLDAYADLYARLRRAGD